MSTNDTEQISYTLEISYTVERYFYTTVMSNEVTTRYFNCAPNDIRNFAKKK